MQITAKAGRGRFVGVAIVRDKDGNPKFDDPNNVPQVVFDQLTDADKAYLKTLKQEK